MKNNSLLLCLSLLLVCLNTHGQSSLRGNIAASLKESMTQKHNQATQLVLKNPNKKDAAGRAVKADTAYYRDIVRKYGWMEGLGKPITQTIARHLPYYYRMSMKNEAGHWQHVEAMHGDSMTTLHPISTYIIDKDITDDNLANKEWVSLLNTVTQWVFTTNFEGTEVYEERSYDAKNNMVYSYSAIKSNDGRMIGSYNDAWGKPADMREDSTSTYGSVVCITYDNNGCDSIIDFLDGQGFRKYNNNGVDQTRFVHDSNGYVTEAMSCNCVGDPIIDNWGNCGHSIVYNLENRSRTKIYRDKDWTPMRMPAKRANGEQTYIRCDYHRDVWGRDSVAIILTADGKPDATLAGIHKIYYNYSPDGELKSKVYYDLNNEIIKPKE